MLGLLRARAGDERKEETMRKLQPLHDYVVFKKLEADRTEAGLLVPATVDTKQRAVVVAVGPGRLDDYGQRVPMSVKVGDHIELDADGSYSTSNQSPGEYFCRESSIGVLVVDMEIC